MRRSFVLATLACAACRAVPENPPPGPEHPASPGAAAAPTPELRATASELLRAREPGPDDGAMDASPMGGGR